MATIRLVPSTYYLSNSSYLSVSNASNMYTNTDSTTYGTVTNSRTSTSSYYIYLRGFNFDDIPDGAIINSFSIRIKGYHSGGKTGTITLYNNTTSVSGGGSATAFGTSVSVHEFTNVTVGFDTLRNYGANLGLRINCRRSSRNTTAYVYIYGAEILVDYTLPVYHSITASTDTGSIDPAGTISILEGDDYTLTITGVTNPTVTDNGVDVTSQLDTSTTGHRVLIPDSYTNSGFTVSNIDNAYTDADDSEYASFELSGGGSTGTLYLNLEGFTLPTGATLQSVSCQATLQYNRNNSSSGYTASCQMYSGNTAKGSATNVVTAGGTDVAKTTFNLTVGSWTANELSSARFYLTATNNASSTHRFIYVYGVSFTITYTVSGVIYTYTLTNVVADHTIVVTGSVATNVLYWKVNGAWVEVDKVYKKINGVWVEQDISSAFNVNDNYVHVT